MPSALPARRVVAACVAVAAIFVVGCSSGGGAHASDTTAPPASSSSVGPGPRSSQGSGGSEAVPRALVWHACQATGGGGPTTNLQCATLQVPLDYANPGAGTISIALDRIRATGTKVGSLLLNPGGPGASGLDFLPEILPQLGSALRQHFDLIGFDPRGIGQSTAVNCGRASDLDRYLQVDGAPPTPTGVNALLAANEQLIAECKAGSGSLLGHVGTVDAARDMDRIRQALGDPQLNYLGFSYGTYLGATYADLFPTHVRAMVLDGAVDPSLPAIQEVDTQAAAVDKELGDFFDWCAANAANCGWTPAGGRGAMQSAVLALINSSRQRPLAATGSARTLGPNQVLYGIANALYDQSSWPQLGAALESASNHDGSQLLSMYDQYVGSNGNGTYPNQVVADDAISCDDQPWPSVADIEAAAAQAQAMAPVFGLANLYSGLLCTSWPNAPTDHPHRITAPGSPPIVVVGSTGDPATPYAWAQALASQLSKGVLLTRVGIGHTGYQFSSCVRTAVDNYLVAETPPATGTTCQSDSSSP